MTKMLRGWALPAAVAVTAAAIVGFGLAPDPARAAAKHKVTMAGSTYGPKTIKAKVGDVVSFDNDDFTNHWVYVPTLGFQVSRAGLKQGESFELALKQPGTFLVECGLHVGMSMTVTVEK